MTTWQLAPSTMPCRQVDRVLCVLRGCQAYEPAFVSSMREARKLHNTAARRPVLLGTIVQGTTMAVAAMHHDMQELQQDEDTAVPAQSHPLETLQVRAIAWKCLSFARHGCLSVSTAARLRVGPGQSQ